MTVSKKHILVVDDSKVSRIMSTGFIRRHATGSTVTEADNATQALAVIQSDNPPDWLVLDHNMPGMCGLDLAEQVRATHPDVRIALLTANFQDAIQQRASNLGVHFFRKPINEALIIEILGVLAQEKAAA